MKPKHLRRDSEASASHGDVWASGVPWCNSPEEFPDVLDYDEVGLVDCEKCLEAYMRVYDTVRQRLNALRKT